MQVNGREIRFLFSVGAKYEIGTLDKALDNFMRTVKTAAIMSRAYEARKKFEDPTHKGRPLTEEEVMVMSDAEFETLCEEITATFTEGNAVTVEAESKKKEAEASSSTTAGVSTTE